MRRRLAVAAVLVLLGLGLSPSAGAAVTGLARAAGDSDAVQRFGSCLAAGGHGDLLLLFDTSPSLENSDPGNQRVEAASYLVHELTSFVETSGASLEVAVAGFAEDYDRSLGWTELDQGSQDRVLDAVDAYSTAVDGFETDYWVAVNGARKELASHAGEGDCTALIWFSDGRYDLDKRDTSKEQDDFGTTKPYGPDVELTTDAAVEKAQRAGVADLCRQGGVADAVRVQGVVTLAIGLQGDQSADDFDLMKGIATGSAVDGSPCGARDGSHTGEFVLARDIDDLIFAFDELADPDHLPIAQETSLCQGEVCAESAHRFVLDPSISSVRILGGTDLPDYYAVLRAPDGTQSRITPGGPLSDSSPSHDQSGEWVSDSVFSVTLTRKRDSGWTGAWELIFVDPASTGDGRARSHLRLYGDVQPAWLHADGAQLTSGQPASLQLGLTRLDGSRVAPSDLKGTVSVGAELLLSDGTTVPIASGLDAAALGAPIALDLGAVPAGHATVHLSLELTTAPAGDLPGTRLEPQSRDYQVDVASPPDYPTLPDHVSFGSADDADPVSTSVPLTGSGCAWLDSDESTSLAEGVTEALVTTDADDAGGCRSKRVEVTLTPDHVGSGLVSGVLHFMVRSDSASGPPIPATVTYSYELERPPNEKLRAGLLLALLVVGLGIPLGILLLVKWLTSKIPGPTLTTVAESGEVSGGASFLDGWRPDPTRLRPQSVAETPRRVVVTGRTRLRARPNLLRLTEAGFVDVEDRTFVCSSGAVLPLAVQDHWVAVLDPTDPHHGPVEVVFLLSSGARRIDALVADARAKVPGAVAQLRRRLGTPPPPPRSGGRNEWGTPVSPGPRPVAPSTGPDNW